MEEDKKKNGAPYGNQNAVGNKGGCPPYYNTESEEDIQTVKNLCESYFFSIEEKTETIQDYYKNGKAKKPVVKIIKKAEPPTSTGLALWLGFESRSTLYEYAKKVEFSHSIKRAMTKIEQYHEIATAYGDKCAGNIFILSNFGWKNNYGVDHTTNGKDIPGTPSKMLVEIVPPESEDE